LTPRWNTDAVAHAHPSSPDARTPQGDRRTTAAKTSGTQERLASQIAVASGRRRALPAANSRRSLRSSMGASREVWAVHRHTNSAQATGTITDRTTATRALVLTLEF
jgi:hypothetical protein